MLLTGDVMMLFRNFFEGATEPFSLPWIDSKVKEARSIIRKRAKVKREILRRLALWFVDGAPDPKTEEPQIDFGALAGGSKPQSPASRLRYCQEHLREVPAVDKMLSPSWDELYAALALDLFLHAYLAGGFAPGVSGDADDESLSPPKIFGEPLTCIAQAVEALAYCRLRERIAFEFSTQKSIDASKAILARHEKLRPVKGDVEKRYFANHSQLSNRQAARKIIADSKESGDLSITTATIAGRDIATVKFKDIEILKTEDVEIRFEKWIAQIKQGSTRKSV